MTVSLASRSCCSAIFGALVALAVSQITATAHAAIGWDGTGNSNWWFDPLNWAQDGGCAMGINPCYIPPIQDTGGAPARNDAQINLGTGAWNVTGEGVVYDPENDPFFDDAANLTFVTGSPLANTAGFMRDYGPETIYRLYTSRNTTNHTLLTIKSGDLVIESTTIIGRSGSSAGAQNLGLVRQLDGQVRLPLVSLDLGQREDSGWGNGTWDYHGGILEVSLLGGSGLRLAPGGSAGTGGHGRFVMRNTDTPGYVRTFDLNVAAHGGDGDGDLTGVGILEFRFDNGATRPLQVVNNLIINNGLDSDGVGIRSARLELGLDSAPDVDGGGVPIDLGLIDVDFDGDFFGQITGTGDLGNFFSSADGSTLYNQGATVSAMFGGTRYDWTISYTGTITWDDPNAGTVLSVADNGFDVDVVLLGLGSEFVGPVGVLGDYNDDGVVNAADYVVWRNADPNDQLLNEGASPGVVDQADYDFWANRFGSTSGAGASSGAIPEPATGLLLVLMSALLACVGIRSGR